MERPFGPGSSQDGEGEVEEDDMDQESAPPAPPSSNGAIPPQPSGSRHRGGQFMNDEMQAARMRAPVTEHQIESGNAYPIQQNQMGHHQPSYAPFYPPSSSSSSSHPYYPPPQHRHPHAQNGHHSSYQPSYNGGQPPAAPYLAPPPPFPPPLLQHDHLYPPAHPQPAPLQPIEPSPPVDDEPSPEDGRPKRERAPRDFFSAGSHSGSAGPSEDGAGAAGGASRKGKEKERSSHNHHYDGTGKKKKDHKKKVIKRDVPADLECSFCEGDKMHNRDGRPEDMVGCYACGRAGHPTCLQMSSKRLVDMVMSYDWRCIECKPCEICKEKGDDEKILFCDKCDRGYHYDCLDPPLSQPPTGSWACSKCRPLRHAHAPEPVDYPPARPPKAKHPNQYTNRPPQPNQYSRPVPPPSKRPPQPNQYSRPSSSRLFSPDEYQAPTPSSIVSKRAVPRVSYRQDPDDDEGEEEDETPPPLPPRIRLKLKRQRAESEEEEDDDDVTSKLPFGGVLSGKDADTTRSKIGTDDKDRFERSRKAAEAKLGGPRPPSQDPYASMPSTPQALGSPAPSGYYPNSPSTSHADLYPPARPLRDQLLSSQTQEHLYPRRSQDPSTPGPSIPSSFSFGAGSSNGVGPSAFEKIKCIRFGSFDIDTWYTAPYPEEYAVVPDGRLWICEFCLKYMKSAFGAGRHRLKCKARHPPGDEVYRDGAVSVFEVDGRKNKIYCQNLCLLAKMFLDHKTLYYDVEPFLFYIMTETDDFGARFVGYFSKEKRSPMNYNVSCIMTLPVRQRKGWGNLLIDFSYLLSKKEARVGSPEKPLSDLGLLSYTNYWTVTLFFYLRTAQSPVTIEAISKATSMTAEDILFVLKAKNMITIIHSSPPPTLARNKSSSSSKIPSAVASKARGSSSSSSNPTASSLAASSLNPRGAAVHTAETTRVTQANFVPQTYSIEWDRDEVERYLEKFEGKGWLRLRPENLKWTAFTDSLALRALKKKKERVEVEEAGERLMGAMEGGGVGGGMVTEVEGGGVGGAAGGDGEGDGAVPMVVDEDPSKDVADEAVVENEIVAEEAPNHHLPLEVVPEDALIPAVEGDPAASGSGSAPIVDVDPSAPSTSLIEPSSSLANGHSPSHPHPNAPPPPLASPTRARRSQSSHLVPPPAPTPAPNPASQSDDPATLALVAALTSPGHRLRSSSASPKKAEDGPAQHPESSPRKRTRNTSAGLGGAGGMFSGSMEPEVVVDVPTMTTTNGVVGAGAAAGGRSMRSSPRKGAVEVEVEVGEEEGGVQVRV